MKYTKCPNCGKKGYYEANARNVGDRIAFGHRGEKSFCKYCNPRGVTKKEHKEFEKMIERELDRTSNVS